ncbi:MAG: hypothetical protein GX589_02070 [Deltaproteobacteria bacterium]|jgi:Tfp pilus assembly protein FimT|nr:hypothetical protein [Deltaproteobacteria bacterium]
MTSYPRKLFESSSGHHLLELICGLALTALLLLLSVTSYAGLVGDQTLKFEARRLKAVLEQLTIDALQRETEIIIEFGERSYLAKKKNEHGGVLLRHQLKNPVRIDAAAKEVRFATLYPSGVSTPLTVILTDGKDFCRIVLSLRSRISLRCGGA